MGTKKIKSKKITYNGINFDSELEKNVYKILVDAGFEPTYEKTSYVVFQSFVPTVPFYDKKKKTKEKKSSSIDIELKNKKINPIKYTPDFEFDYNGKTIIVECKGRENESFPLRKKLFRRYLEDNKKNSMYFEVRNKHNAEQMIKIIKNEE